MIAKRPLECLVVRQIWTLMQKNILCLLRQHRVVTFLIAFIVPVSLSFFFTFIKHIYLPPAKYGVGIPRPIMKLHEAMEFAHGSGHDTLMLVNGTNDVGAWDNMLRVFELIEEETKRNRSSVKTMRIFKEDDLEKCCRSTLRGVTRCFAAVVMHNAPPAGPWNYTIRTDAVTARGHLTIKAHDSKNDEQVYLLPLQRAVDRAITQIEVGDGPNPLDGQLCEIPFTSETQSEYEHRKRRMYLSSIVSFMGVGFITTIVWATYHLAGVVATDRESGITRLIDAMMPSNRPSSAQATRIIAHHLSFSVLYAPAWIVAGIVFRSGIFIHTSFIVILLLQLLGGLAIVSFTIFCASFFGRAQLSSALTTICTLVLAIVAQTVTSPETTTVAILSTLFAPCSYVYFITLMARFERADRATHLTQAAPGESPWNLPGLVLLLLLALQIVIYPLLAAWVERWRFGTPADGRHLARAGRHLDDNVAVRLDDLTKVYYPAVLPRLAAFFRCGGGGGGGGQTTEPVVAVNGLNLSCPRGQIVTLLGANGSGKSTTLNAIAGLLQPTSGSIVVEGTCGLGIAPQNNVLWDDVSVEDHLKIFGRLKSPARPPTADETAELIKAIDLWSKRNALARTLSGGQKRKLQLGLMLAGGSAVCCVDEVSSGLDPISRRKIWDILLAERGRRTLILTTHFLDEADLLADHIAVLSRGTLRAAGSSAELKERFGGGYHVRIPAGRGLIAPEIEGVDRKEASDGTTYVAQTSDLAARAIQQLDATGIDDYHFSSPNIEDVFLRLVEEVEEEQQAARPAAEEGIKTDDLSQSDGSLPPPLKLMDGADVGNARQMAILLWKRVTVFKRNWLLFAVAFSLPIFAAALTSLYVRGKEQLPCSAPNASSVHDALHHLTEEGHQLMLLAGPTERTPGGDLLRVLMSMFNEATRKRGSGPGGDSGLLGADPFRRVETYDGFLNFTKEHSHNLTTGIWLGDDDSSPTMAWWANKFITSALLSQQFLNSVQANVTILTSWVPFDTPLPMGLGSVLNLVAYMGLTLILFPAFFSLYPSSERRSGVRALQYSNGVRPLPLWTAYLAFDMVFILGVSALATGIWAAMADTWYHVGYMLIVITLYGVASTIFSYVISLYTRSQLQSFGWSAFTQGIFFLAYMVAYMMVLTYVPAERVDSALVLSHFLLAAWTPIGSLVRSFFITTNLFATACNQDQKLSTRPASLLIYGGPILYLALQSITLFGLLVWLDGGRSFREGRRRRRRHGKDDGGEKQGAATASAVAVGGKGHDDDDDDDGGDDDEEEAAAAAEKKNEEAEVMEVKKKKKKKGKSGVEAPENEGLRVMNLTKSFGRNTAVDNISFEVRKGEVFALLGPNGAGKSTTMALIRGDERPSRNGGDVFVGPASVTRNRAAARSRLGVCPQMDALDAQMTVREHLEFYARVRGVSDVDYNVSAVLEAVKLQGLTSRMATSLSGGNKRKLSLAIALMGNPDVILLDEPSSGLDAAAKRVLWPVLSATAVGRCILLTTHSMEEADALASRAGILARRMLALGSLDELRSKAGDRLYVHLVTASAPRTPASDMDRIADWVRVAMPGAEIESETYHGQMRFSVRDVDVKSAAGNLRRHRRVSQGEGEEGEGEEGEGEGEEGEGEEGEGEEGEGEGEQEQQGRRESRKNEDDDDDKNKAQSPSRNKDEEYLSSPSSPPKPSSHSALGQLVVLLQRHKDDLGVEHYSVSPTTLDQVFLSIVGSHDVDEEMLEMKDSSGKLSFLRRLKNWASFT